MDILKIKFELVNQNIKENISIKKNFYNSAQLDIYSKSIFEKNNILFFIAREGFQKFLFLVFDDSDDKKIPNSFTGVVYNVHNEQNVVIKKCELTTSNRKALQQQFEFTQPKVLGLVNSFGFGDRIGLANAAHIRSLEQSEFKPILAQQSIRELNRTNRTPDEVMDAAVWAVFQEGYTGGFGADADHLKTTDDIDIMVQSGFKMFTFDPSEYVHNEADSLNNNELYEAVNSLNWTGLQTKKEYLINYYANKTFSLADDLKIQASASQVLRALLKYGDALAYIKKMYDYLAVKYEDYESEVEVSVDETESITTPFEHYFIVKELNRLGVKIISLAPRFVGRFEKGIDYIGDLNLFKKEYIKHVQIVKHFGNYKISLHSGSDKFYVYKVIGEINEAVTHIKTAGTSYLEALKIAAMVKPNLFRKILDYSLSLYEAEKKSYHVSADVSKLKSSSEYSNSQLPELFNYNGYRQVLHVTFGRILTDKNENGEFIFKNELVDCLTENEELHYKVLIDHFRKHLNPFKKYDS